MDTRIRLLLRVIDECDGKMPLTSEQIGELLGLGEARVLRLFNLEVGKTLRRHLLEVRMARAYGFLRESLLPIKNIASTCGYTVVSNFYRDFKKVYGMSPLQTRLTQIDIGSQDQNSRLGWMPRFDTRHATDWERPANLNRPAAYRRSFPGDPSVPEFSPPPLEAGMRRRRLQVGAV